MSAAFIEAHRKRRKFTTDELRALMAEGITQSEAARRLGVTQAAVANRLEVEGLTWPKLRREVDLETFTRLWNCHRISTEEIAQWMGVTRQAVSDRARRMGLPSRAKVRKRLVRDDELRELWLAGVSTTDIAKLFGLASCSCVSRAVLLADLPRRKRGIGGNTHGGWIGTISLYDYRQSKLAERMAQAIGKAGH
jgi:predicted transcriptional regulator